MLNAGAPLLTRLVAKAGPVYGSFATVAGIFALLYLVGQALVYAAEVAAVRYARLWRRALDLNHPTAADARALALLAREQERIPAARVQFHLAARASAPVRVVPRQPAIGQANAKTSRSGRRAKDFDTTVRAGGTGQDQRSLGIAVRGSMSVAQVAAGAVGCPWAADSAGFSLRGRRREDVLAGRGEA